MKHDTLANETWGISQRHMYLSQPTYVAYFDAPRHVCQDATKTQFMV